MDIPTPKEAPPEMTETTPFEEARAAVRAGASPEEAAEIVLRAMSEDEKLWCLDGDAPCWKGLEFLSRGGYHMAPFRAARVPRIRFPGFNFADGPRGVVVGNATAFPVSSARGATWDPLLEEQVGDVIGRELRAVGADLFGGVCVNLLRHPGWGRAQETYGEDPHHVGEMAAALTRGVQRHAMACVKHFACNSIERSRFRVDVTIDDVALHDVELAPFRRVIDEGVAAVMSAYNSVNGEFCGENAALLSEVLRGRWGFAGFVISDWIFGLRDASKSLRAGLDVEMPYRMVRARDLPAALDEGRVGWGDVERAVARVVATRLRFDHVLSKGRPDRSVLGSQPHRDLARQVAAASAVVLSNRRVGDDPAFPLPAGLQNLLVVGDLASGVNMGDSGSSDVWSLEPSTILGALEERLPGRVVHVGDDPEAAATTARTADAAIVVVGCTYADEGEYIGEPGVDLSWLFPAADEPEVVEVFEREIASLPPVQVPPHVAARPQHAGFGVGGDRTFLGLRPEHVRLVRAVTAECPRTVVVLQGGSAFLLDEILDLPAALVHSFYGGCEAGRGLSDVLFGDLEPRGRLPFTMPASPEHLPPFDPQADQVVYDGWHGWWLMRRLGVRPAFPFGFGLGSTTFELSDARAARRDGGLRVTGRASNVGRDFGSEVVQVYVTPVGAPDKFPRLAGFTRVQAEPGETVAFSVDVTPETLMWWDARLGEPRPFTGVLVVEVARHEGDPAALKLPVDL